MMRNFLAICAMGMLMGCVDASQTGSRLVGQKPVIVSRNSSYVEFDFTWVNPSSHERCVVWEEGFVLLQRVRDKRNTNTQRDGIYVDGWFASARGVEPDSDQSEINRLPVQIVAANSSVSIVTKLRWARHGLSEPVKAEKWDHTPLLITDQYYVLSRIAEFNCDDVDESGTVSVRGLVDRRGKLSLTMRNTGASAQFYESPTSEPFSFK